MQLSPSIWAQYWHLINISCSIFEHLEGKKKLLMTLKKHDTCHIHYKFINHLNYSKFIVKFKFLSCYKLLLFYLVREILHMNWIVYGIQEWGWLSLIMILPRFRYWCTNSIWYFPYLHTFIIRHAFISEYESHLNINDRKWLQQNKKKQTSWFKYNDRKQ